ncbi:hypothetical protein PHYPO_G00203290 [Pangasianodon hypophthalmus]|uniref:CW-type domain-containing protein n=1 Tax=Pangasianodon hypophthalmus TaxID=310915 RepID=A0A5N5PD06_PANHP|nr:hypothetical protein PHYPO_G00203290 [Pangasianodon hypophthalmus]
MDNGKGMDYDKMHKMLSFGFSDKQTIRGHVPVGLYGNGFKSGSMRLGKDAIVFSKKANTMCVGLLSQTYLEKIKAQDVIVPIVMFTKTRQTISAAPEYAECLRDILTHSLFQTEEELLTEFNVIKRLCSNSSGTRIIIWNLRRTSSGSSEELEFDFMKDPNDIQIRDDANKRQTRKANKRQPGGGMSVPESEYSLRAYCSILYLKPRMQIILRGLKVETQFVTKTLAKVYRDTYKPVGKEGITITFGYNTKSKEHYGLMMYHKNRLIKAYERVACQRKANNTGVGVIGVIECNYLTPTHNKQDFDNSDEYRKTMLSVGAKLEDYWKEVHYRHNTNCTEPFEDTVKTPDQNWVQCDDCMKWRKLPDGIDAKQLPKKWFCHMNSDPQFRSCSDEEEAEDSDGDQPKYQKTYKQQERHQKLLQENRQQSPSTPCSSVPMTPRPSDVTSADTQDTSLSTTPKRKALKWSLENPETKKARKKAFDDQVLLFSHASDATKAEYKDIKTALNDDGDDVIDKCMMKEEQSNKITPTSSKDQQNYKVLYLQSVEEIKQLQHKLKQQLKKEPKEEVDSLKDEKNNLLTSYERLQKDLEEVKRENEKVMFHCKMTNLVFEMKGKGEVLYTVVSWDNSQLQGTGQFQPAGPLYSIKCSEGSVLYLHLPHCEIHTDKNQIELAVAHCSEGNIEILQPLKVTSTHVIIEVQHLSLFGLLKKWIFQETPISAQVLLFYQKMQIRRKLHIHLLPGNVPIEEVQNQHKGNTYIQCSAICQLTPGKKYRPLCEPYVCQPKAETFGCNYGPNYHPTFEVILNTEVEDLTLGLLDEIGQEVWEPRQVFLTGSQEFIFVFP